MDPVGIFWDLENCGVPRTPSSSSSSSLGTSLSPAPSALETTLPESVASNVRDFARQYGKVVAFNAYADFSGLARATRLGLQQSGVSLLDVPNCAKDAADKAMIVDLCFFAVENKVPATVILISGDRDFASALQRLCLHGWEPAWSIKPHFAAGCALICIKTPFCYA
mmetsp:Transcript_4806/g.13373  ORF Transcript_4806/g.13373 Transcript_4806/m.13373 type:complete len:167 (-) Transcript_4806:2027-2527(-)